MKLPTVVRLQRRARRRWRGENGNIMVISALLMTVFMGMLALTVDIGFLAGQRRFMQNGADAGSLAAARLLAGSVSPRADCNTSTTICTFFTTNDAAVRDQVTDIARRNQNTGLTARTTNFTVLIQYCVATAPGNYDYSASNNNCQAAGNSWVASPTANGRVPDGAYKVRVTTSSTITTLFGTAAGWQAQEATSANAVALIMGVCEPRTASGKILPFTLWDRQDFGSTYGTLYELWGSTAPSPSFAGSWQNMIDLTPANRWCDNDAAHPDYKWLYPAMIPSGVQCNHPDPNVAGSTSFTGTDTSWNRAGYAPDPRSCYTGQVESSPDLANWAAGGYNGTLAVGNKVPTYQDAQPAQGGNGGANVAQGIYGSPTAPPCTGGQFFFSNPDGPRDPNPDFAAWGPYKDVLVFTYDDPEYWKTSSNTWTTARSGGAPGRVTVKRILNFRIYRDYTSANSRIYGRVVSPVFPPNTATCGGPNFFGNIVRAGS